MTVADIQQMFAKYGFTETPLTVEEIKYCFEKGFEEEEIFWLGCDLAAGYQWHEAIYLYLKETA